ncbi:MAG: IS1634 family transposase [Anaerolineae bacterium]
MFVRKKRSVHNGRTYEYLQVVHAYREGKRVRQRVVATLGRRDTLVRSGQVDGLLRSLARFSEQLRVVEAVRSKGLQARTARPWGPALVFGRLWEQQGLPAIVHDLARHRKFGFDVERVTFALALQRLCAPGSDLQGAGWIRTVEAPGFTHLALQHFYRTVAFLAEVREDLERELFLKDRDLFTQSLEVLFIDTTSLYVYRNTETAWRKRGYSRDRRPDLPQFVLCVVVNEQGWPIAWEIFPGNTADLTALQQIVAKLRERFAIRRAVIVADRGMLAQKTIALLQEHPEAPFDYVLGCRMRRQKEVSEKVLARAGRYHRVDDHLEVKEVRVGKRRYVVCRNRLEAKKDAAARAAVLATIEEKLGKGGPKSLLGNRGFARFLTVAKGSVSINQEAVRHDARLDGKFVVTTSTELAAPEVARIYKSLWRVERTFREEKSTLAVRPIYHRRDNTSIGHIVACFLALRLEVDLQRRLDERAVDVSWPDLMRDLGQVHAAVVDCDGNRYRLRTDLVGSAYQAFRAAGVRPPPLVTFLGPAPEAERTDLNDV